MNAPALVWLRRDLRLFDHRPLARAAASGRPILCAFVFDPAILEALPSGDRRVGFIVESLAELRSELAAFGSALAWAVGDPSALIPQLAAAVGAPDVFAGKDFEPSAVARDAAVGQALLSIGSRLVLEADHPLFEPGLILSESGSPFKVFTPYKNAWRRRLAAGVGSCPTPEPADFLPAQAAPSLPAPWTFEPPRAELLGFAPFDRTLPFAPGTSGARAAAAAFASKISAYAAERDLPALPAASALGPHLRFGTASVRALASWALSVGGAGAETWLSELAWRDFWIEILARRPAVADGEPFHRAFDAVAWIDDPAALEAWKAGRTGYPLVDAGMRELSSTGTMHNRVRMLAASFLSKHLLARWTRGEAHFASELMDFELASNCGNWQWCAGVGLDSQPWFRIFNPILQSRKFDPQGVYIRRWIPELAAVPGPKIHEPWKLSAADRSAYAAGGYPNPIVEHSAARLRALAAYGAAAKPAP